MLTVELAQRPKGRGPDCGAHNGLLCEHSHVLQERQSARISHPDPGHAVRAWKVFWCKLRYLLTVSAGSAGIGDGDTLPVRQAGKALTVRLADPHIFAAAPIHWQGELHGGITRPCDFRPTHRSAVIPDGATPDGRL